MARLEALVLTPRVDDGVCHPRVVCGVLDVPQHPGVGAVLARQVGVEIEVEQGVRCAAARVANDDPVLPHGLAVVPSELEEVQARELSAVAGDGPARLVATEMHGAEVEVDPVDAVLADPLAVDTTQARVVRRDRIQDALDPPSMAGGHPTLHVSGVEGRVVAPDVRPVQVEHTDAHPALGHGLDGRV